MGVSSVTLFEGIIRAKTLVFIGVLATFSRPASSLTPSLTFSYGKMSPFSPISSKR